MKRRHRWEILVVAISTVMMAGLHFYVVPFLEFVELKAWDLHFLERGVVKPSGKVVFVTIDEESINQEGRWPWPRRNIAQLFKAVQDYGARVIGLDMGFFEDDLKLRQHAMMDVKALLQNDPSFADKALVAQIDALAGKEDDDVILSNTIRQLTVPLVLGHFFYFDDNTFHPPTPPPEVLDRASITGVRIIHEPPAGTLNDAVGMEINIPIIEQAASFMGSFNVFADPDGAVRWMPLVIRYENRLFPSLALETLTAGFPEHPVTVTLDRQGVQSIHWGPISIPTNNRGEILVNHYGSAYLFPHYSATRIMRHTAPADCLKGRVVVIGNTTEGLHDMRPTPFFPAFPGVELHCAVIENIMNQQFLSRSDRTTPFYDIIAIVACGMVFFGISLLFHGISPLTATAGVLIAGYIAVTHYAFLHDGIWLNHVYPVLNIIVCYMGVSVHRYLTEEREKRMIRQTFGLYVHRSVVEEMLEHPEQLKLGGEKKELSVLFSDIRGFTTLSEEVPPERLVPQLNEYLTQMTQIVFDQHGTLDKYIGDAIMAIFGAPLRQTDHPYRACCTALDMIRHLKNLQNTWQQQGKPIFHIGIGINSGGMIVGNMGSENRFDYTVLGDNVNLASRLEGLTKMYGVPIIVSEMTWEQVKTQLIGRELDIVRVKGKHHAVRIYQLLGRIGEQNSFETPLRVYQRGVACFRNRNWEDAEKLFKRVEDWWPDDPPSRLYQQRCRELLEKPPTADWNFVTVLDHK